jgi:hypothetical protein
MGGGAIGGGDMKIMLWLIRVLQNDNGGHPRLSFSKLAIVVFLATLVVYTRLILATAPWLLAVLWPCAIAASYGRHAFSEWLKFRSDTHASTSITTTNVADVIKALRAEPNLWKDDERA